MADKEARHVFALRTCNLVSTVSIAVRKRTWIYKTQFITLHLNITLIKDMADVWANGLLVTLKVLVLFFFLTQKASPSVMVAVFERNGFSLLTAVTHTLQCGTKYSRNEPISDFHTHTLDVQCFSDVYQMVPFNNRVIVPQ